MQWARIYFLEYGRSVSAAFLGCVSFPGLVGDPGRYLLMQRGR